MARIELGDKARDRITGYEGIVIGMTQHLTGCDTVTIKRPGFTEKGDLYEAHLFDEPFVELLEKQVVVPVETQPEGPRTTGGPHAKVTKAY